MQRHKKRSFGIRSGHADDIEAAYRSSDGVFRVLDLGCGRGRYHEDMRESLENIGDRDIEIIGLDNNPAALGEGTQAQDYLTADAAPIPNDGNAKYLPFQDESFDLVYSSHLLCQLEEAEVEAVRRRAERVLKDAGTQVHEI